MIYFPNTWEESIITVMERQNTKRAIQVCHVDIYCEKKYRFPLLIFVIEKFNTCTAVVSRKSVLNSKIQASTYSNFSV